jgi:hypothetical protein
VRADSALDLWPREPSESKRKQKRKHEKDGRADTFTNRLLGKAKRRYSGMRIDERVAIPARMRSSGLRRDTHTHTYTHTHTCTHRHTHTHTHTHQTMYTTAA